MIYPKIIIILILGLMLVFIAVIDVHAIPVPHGVSGFIYDLDGVTQVPKLTEFSINNTANEYFIQGGTGRGSNSGKFAASINGDNGDVITIKAWNIEHNSTKTLALDGVTRNLTLLLNMTFTQYSPNITSIPIENATEDVLYVYDVNATDKNTDDVLVYSLIKSPDQMIINASTGLILWTPKNNQVGDNHVFLQVSDGILVSNQSFNISVANVNDAPNITTEPSLNVTVNLLYVYDLNATDDDGDNLSYHLIQAPPKMNINASGFITWKPRPKDAGNHSILVQVSDGKLNASQLFNVQVISLKILKKEAVIDQASSGGSLSRPSNAIGTQFIPNKAEQDKRAVRVQGPHDSIKEIMVRFKNFKEDAYVEVERQYEKPTNVKVLQKRVYQYMEIKKVNFDNQDLEEAELLFDVENSWLESNSVDPVNIVLNRYYQNAWEELPTELIELSDQSATYKSVTEGFSIFAISVKSEARISELNDELHAIDLNQILGEAYIFSGFILRSDGIHEVDEGTFFSLENLQTNEVATGETGIGQSSGGFSAVISGNKGDSILMTVGKFRSAKGIFNLSGDIHGVSVIVNSDQLLFNPTNFINTIDNSITGYMSALGGGTRSMAGAFLFVLIAVGLILNKSRIRKERKRWKLVLKIKKTSPKKTKKRKKAKLKVARKSRTRKKQ